MAAGNNVDRADSILNVYRNTAYAAITNVWVRLHTGDPGAAGTANGIASGVGSTRQEVTFAAPSGGSMAKSNTPTWAAWDSGTLSLTHISLWTASTAGTFLESFQATSPVGVEDGNDVTLNTLNLSISPLATT